jgi:hypothetical protein
MGAVIERKATASQDRGALAKMVMTLLDHWKLSTEDQAALLGIATSNRAALAPASRQIWIGAGLKSLCPWGDSAPSHQDAQKPPSGGFCICSL